ncbi:MAG: hypothetical protein Q9188_002227 [Gyalolechia gomerana]
MDTPLKANANGSYEAEYATPSLKRQRTTRASASSKSMNYDMKYHPIDDVLRPAASAARKAAHGLDTRRLSTTSDSTTFIEDAEDSDNTQEGANLKPSPKTCAAVTGPFASPPRRPVPPRSGSPSGRRITRAEVNGERPVLYDMRHHPMDVVTRPAAAKRVYEKYSSFSESHLTSPGTTPRVERPPKESSVPPSAPDVAEGSGGIIFSQWPITATEIPIITPATTPNQGMTKKPATSLWKSLSNFERLMYRFQKGAPVDSSTLPMLWKNEALALQAIFGIDASDSQVEVIQNQYAGLHRRLQVDFGAGQEPSEIEDWTLHYAEDFDVYDLGVGNKYFKYRGDSVVQPPFHRACDWIVCRIDGENKVQEVNVNESDNPRSQEGLRGGHGERETGSETTDNGDGHGGSYNDAEGYLRQSRGRYDDDLLIEDNAEDELIASMQNSASAIVEDVMGINELAPMFPSSSGPNEDEDSEPAVRQRPLNWRSRNRATRSNFSVHEDEPGSTPRIKRQVAMNPRSPGTDIPKENLPERSASEELGS